MAEAFIYDAVRTPRGKGKPDGALYSVKPVNLMAGLLRELQARTELDTSRVDDVILGCVTPVGDQGGDIAKVAPMKADWDVRVAGVQLNRFCASGLEAVNMAAAKVKAGSDQLLVAGGVESMSRVPMGSDGWAWGMDPEMNLHTYFVPQGISADLIATVEGLTREDVDAYALRSQQRAATARHEGRFERSLIPVVDQNGSVLLAHDELIRPDATSESMAALRPSFEGLGAQGFDDTALLRYSHLERIDHVHTPANSSGIVDGAAAMLVGSEAIGRELELQPRARIVAMAITSNEPTIMLTAPAPATRKVLAQAGLTPDDIDLYEINEAFAAVVLRYIKEMQLPEEKVNVNGGAIAMGHPLGATGCMILGTLLDELERRQLRRGLATLCAGGGMGIATIIERI